MERIISREDVKQQLALNELLGKPRRFYKHVLNDMIVTHKNAMRVRDQKRESYTIQYDYLDLWDRIPQKDMPHILFLLSNQSYEDYAQELGISTKTLKRRMECLRSRLRLALVG